MEENHPTQPVPAWPVAVAVPACLSSAVILFLFVDGAIAWKALGGVLAAAAVAALVAGDRMLRARIQSLMQAAEDELRKADEARESLRSREAEVGRLQADLKRRTSAYEAEKEALADRLKSVMAESEEARASLQALQAAAGQLRDQNSVLQAERADAIQRRQLLQSQYQDLEVTSRQLGASHAERTAQYRAAMDSTEQAKSELERLRAAEIALVSERQSLQHQVERLEQERRSFDFRERALRDEADALRLRLGRTEAEAESAKAQRSLHEELAARRVELDRLAEELGSLRAQLELARDRAESAEHHRDDALAAVQRGEERIAASDVVIGQLQDEVRNVSTEARSDMAQHFVWRLNFFESHEIKLNFTNDGAAVDLVDIRSEPALNCAFEGSRRLERGAEATLLVRPAKGAKAPEDLRLFVRYTLRPQEAVFRLRPYASNKIERL